MDPSTNGVRLTPDGLSAKEVWAGTPWAFTILGFVLFAICLAMSIRQLRSRGERTPLLLTIGGFLSGFVGEPLIDLLAHGWWPHDLPGPVITTFGVQVPLLIPPVYAFYLGGSGYVAYLAMARGITVKGLFGLWAIFVVADAAFQVVGLNLGLYVFYGDQPFKFFDTAFMYPVMDCTAYLFIALLTWWMVPHLRAFGWSVLLVVPLAGWLGGCLMTTWPTFMALATDMSSGAAWALSSVSIALNVLAVWGMALIVATDSAWREERGAAPAPAARPEPVDRVLATP